MAQQQTVNDERTCAYLHTAYLPEVYTTLVGEWQRVQLFSIRVGGSVPTLLPPG